MQKKIDANQINEYHPQTVSARDVLDNIDIYNLFVNKILSKYDKLVPSDDFSRDYYQIFITKIDKKIHYEIVKKESGYYLALDLENKSFCNENVKSFLDKVVLLKTGFLTNYSQNKMSIRCSINADNFDSLFDFLYVNTIDFLIENF